MKIEEFIDLGNGLLHKISQLSKKDRKINVLHDDKADLVYQFGIEELGLTKYKARQLVKEEEQDGNEFDYDRFYTWYIINRLFYFAVESPYGGDLARKLMKEVIEEEKQRKIVLARLQQKRSPKKKA